MSFLGDVFDAWKGLVVAGVGLLLTFTPLAPLGAGIMAYGLGMTLDAILPLPQRNATFRANSVSTANPIHVIVGEAIAGGAVADYPVLTSNRKFMYAVICGSHASRDGTGIEAIEEIFIDGELAVPAGAPNLGPGGHLVTDAPIVSFFQDGLDYGKFLGADTQTVPNTLNLHFGSDRWPTTSRGRGVAHIVCKFENKPEKFPGLPNVTARWKGPLVFDPRDTTWKWSKNPALWIREALVNPIWGKGRPESEMDDASFSAAADHCDELVSVPDGMGGSTTQPRYEVSGVWDTSLTVERNLDMLEQSCMGRVIPQGGKYRLFIRQAQTPTGFVFDDSNVLRGGEFGLKWKMPGLADDGANSIVVSYIEPGALQADGSWTTDTVNELQWPEVGAANPYLAEDAGFDAPKHIELPFVRNRYRALQIGSILLKEMREGDRFQFIASQEALELEVGDVATLDIDLLDDDAPLDFWVMEMKILAGGRAVGITGMKYNAAAYTLPTLTEIPDPGESGLPRFTDVGDPTGLGLTAVRSCVDGVTTAIEIIAAWTNPASDPHDAMEIRYRNDDVGGGTPGPWIYVSEQRADSTSAMFNIPDFDDQATYRVGIRSRNPSGAVGNWVEDTVDMSAVPCTTDVNVGGAGQNHGTVSGAINISFLDGWIQVIEPDGDLDVTLVDTFAGSVMRPLQLLVLQQGGPWNITIAVENSGTIKWSPDGTVPDLTQLADAEDSFSFSAIAQDLVYGQQMGRDYG